MKPSVPLKNSLFLLLAATIWGVAFVAQSVGMEYVQPFTFSAVRSLIGGAVLLPLIWYQNRRITEPTNQNAEDETSRAAKNRTLWQGGLACGFLLFLATNLQQFGIQYTNVGKAGFLTACYIVLVPVFNFLLFRRKTGPLVLVSVAAAVVGLYLLCITDAFTIQLGDGLMLLCAVVFSFHILVIGHFSPLTDGVKLSCIQFFICGLLSSAMMFLTEQPNPANILQAWLPILYAGALSCGVAYTLQVVGQENMNPTVASLILSMESVVSVLAGWLLLKQTLTLKEILGCIIMFAAIILAQLPSSAKSKIS